MLRVQDDDKMEAIAKSVIKKPYTVEFEGRTFRVSLREKKDTVRLSIEYLSYQGTYQLVAGEECESLEHATAMAFVMVATYAYDLNEAEREERESFFN